MFGFIDRFRDHLTATLTHLHTEEGRSAFHRCRSANVGSIYQYSLGPIHRSGPCVFGLSCTEYNSCFNFFTVDVFLPPSRPRSTCFCRLAFSGLYLSNAGTKMMLRLNRHPATLQRTSPSLIHLGQTAAITLQMRGALQAAVVVVAAAPIWMNLKQDMRICVIFKNTC